MSSDTRKGPNVLIMLRKVAILACSSLVLAGCAGMQNQMGGSGGMSGGGMPGGGSSGGGMPGGQQGGQQGGQRQIGVQIRPADPAFDPHRLGPIATEPKARRAVIDRPADLGGRKGALGEPLVAVDIRRQEHGQIGGVFELPGQVGFHHR